MGVSAKSLKIAAQLAESLALRCGVAGLGASAAMAEVSQDVDSDGNPTILVTDDDGSAGDASVFIRVKAISNPNSYDIIGNVAQVYANHVVQIASERNSSGEDVMLLSQMMAAHLQCALAGCRLEVWQEANGVAPSITTFDTANKLKLVFEPHMYFPVVSDQ